MTPKQFIEKYSGCRAFWRNYSQNHSVYGTIIGCCSHGDNDHDVRIKFLIDDYRYEPGDYHTPHMNYLEVIPKPDNKPLPLPG